MRYLKPKKPFLLSLALVCYATAAHVPKAPAEDWRQFRGPQGNGSLALLKHPTQWSEQNNLAWQSKIPGGGWSSPIVVANRIFLTTAVSAGNTRPKGFSGGVAAMRSFSNSNPPSDPVSFELHCLDLSDGSLVWKRTIEKMTPPFKIHPSNTYATESPVATAERIYAYFAAVGVVACYDHEGEEIWKREVGAFPTANNFGTGSSLAIDEELVYLQCDNQQQSFVIALNATDGTVAWRKDRPGGTSWSSPILWNNRQRTELILCGSGSVTSYQTQNGAILWNLTGTGGSFTASPATDKDRIYFGNSGPASRGPLLAVNAGASGNIAVAGNSPALAWSVPASGPGMGSPVAHNNRVYVLSRGILSCHDSSTGGRIYRNRLPGASRVAASMWAAGEEIFILDEVGNTFVVNAGSEFELLSQNTIDGLFWSTPSVSGESLLLRSADALFCVRSEQAKGAVSSPR